MTANPPKPKRRASELADRDDERTLLAGLIENSECLEDVEHLVGPDDLFYGEHRALYRLIRELAAQGPADEPAIVAAAVERGVAEYGGVLYICQLRGSCPANVGLTACAERLRRLAIRRELRELAGRLRDACYEELELDDALAVLDHGAATIRRTGNAAVGWKDMAHLVAGQADATELLARDPEGGPAIPSGFVGVDGILGGFRRGDLVIFGALPAMGKTALATQIVLNAARTCPVGIVELEMSGNELAQRVLSNLAGIDYDRIRSGRLLPGDLERLDEGRGRLAAGRVFVDDAAGITASQIRMRVQRLKRAHPQLGLVAVDYIQITKPETRKTDTRERAIAEISLTLKTIAREFDVCVLALSQLNRQLHTRDVKKPMLSDLRESGSLEADADVVMFLHREEYYNPGQMPGIAEVIVAKNRKGKNGTARLVWSGSQQRFRDLDERHEEPTPRMGSVTPYRGPQQYTREVPE